MTAPTEARPVTPVGIAAERLADVLVRLDALPDPGPGIRRDLEEAYRIVAGLEPYLERCAGPEPEDLAALAARTRATDWGSLDSGTGLEQEMLSGHVEARFLQLLVRATRARSVLEIGMFTGYSALALAQALPEDGTVVACEIDPTAAGIAQEHFDRSPVGSRIRVALGPAQETLARLAEDGRRFDLVFLDADKAGYLDYLRTLLDRDLLADDALVCVDNTLLQGQPWATSSPTANGAAIAAFNTAVAADPRLDQVVVPLRDGLTLIRRR